MGKTLINAILILVTCCIIAGCNDGCTDPYIAYNVGSVTKDSETNVSYFNVWGVGVDSFMVENASSGNIELLLNSNSNETVFGFVFYVPETTTNDEGKEVTTLVEKLNYVTFSYENIPFFLDMECGCSVHHIINSVELDYGSNEADKIIKSIQIVNPEITNEKAINFTLNY